MSDKNVIPIFLKRGKEWEDSLYVFYSDPLIVAYYKKLSLQGNKNTLGNNGFYDMPGQNGGLTRWPVG